MVAVKATFLHLIKEVRKMSIAVVIKKWFQPFRTLDYFQSILLIVYGSSV